MVGPGMPDGTTLGTYTGSHDEPVVTVVVHSDRYALDWDACGRLADFVSHYAGACFTRLPEQGPDLLEREEIESAISYILNELMENAFKFRSGGSIQVRLEIGESEIRFLVSNQITPDDQVRARRVFEELLSDDPETLYLRRIEENALRDATGDSGLGFLSIMNDYGASLGWCFDLDGQGRILLTTQTCFPIRRAA